MNVSRIVCNLFRGKPKSLGDGLRRVVKAAGDGKPGTLVRYGQSGGQYMCGLASRTYSNGVQIRYGSDIRLGPGYTEKCDVLGIFKPHSKFNLLENSNFKGPLYKSTNAQKMKENPNLLEG